MGGMVNMDDEIKVQPGGVADGGDGNGQQYVMQ